MSFIRRCLLVKKQIKGEMNEYLLKGQIYDIVTEISSSKRGEGPKSNTEVVLKRSIIKPEHEEFVYYPFFIKKENTLKFFEPIAKEERLIILGGGHISKYLCEFAAKTGFDVRVVDEREEFASKERFPEAKDVICGAFAEVLPQLNINKNDYVAIVTRGHSCDGDCLYYILTHEIPGYLGMIGSKKRVSAQFEMFRAMGISEEKIAQVHNPIGLAIKGVTPAEIAVSILAELILTKRTKKTDGTVQTELDYEVLLEWLNGSRPCAMATILNAQGSSPRKEGAKMLIFEDKSILGSVGGGLAESKVIEKGYEIIGTGKAFLFHFVMDADVAARSGMACGGTFDMLIEDVIRE